MCFFVATKDPHEFKYGLGDKQTYAYQQFFFELPFYTFLVVIASVLFSWQEMLELFYCQCREDVATAAADSLSGTTAPTNMAVAADPDGATSTGVNTSRSARRPVRRDRASSNASLDQQ